MMMMDDDDDDDHDHDDDADDSYDGENYAKYKSQIEVVIKAMLFNLSCTSVLDISKLNS